MSAVIGDTALSSMFNALPLRCIVLLEDIDAVGMRREAVSDQGSDEQGKSEQRPLGRMMPHPHGNATGGSRGNCTLSGLLNVLDGVASQEGRIVLMTSNDPDGLDEALLRPGRVDRRYYLGHMKRPAIEAMFLRMFEPETPADDVEKSAGTDKDSPPTEDDGSISETMRSREKSQELGDEILLSEVEASLARQEVLAEQAREFAAMVPEGRFTPAKLQGYLLMHSESAAKAIRELPAWIEEDARDRERAQAKQDAARGASSPRPSDGVTNGTDTATGRDPARAANPSKTTQKAVLNGFLQEDGTRVNGTH
ncbi:uncharacterized protein B0I36DRAFT_321332 [Microdochium trichocladiopsis]|uniref:ATPase AAA-type core domain-containing protein n=1 Tax=Microdochium trichocladiopsis TaxID=1682393 RepID=A0A9P9BVI9_9PEZI|nr:uncharacterized protein B0I36DRAFT_321332 [Microdochium trichocladiopsis]KAH7033387.1 hypothetical protein B0I36DRAFT_321332 [Microdochium trichocladiopsis]